VIGTDADAFAAVDAALLDDDRFFITNTVGLRGASFDTVVAALAQVLSR
jgi:hypothetical protein